MAKKRKRKRRKPTVGQAEPPAFQWMGDGGMHMVAPGAPPTPDQLEQMTKQYQERIRNSPLWDAMVREFGEEKAEELLKDFKVQLG